MGKEGKRGEGEREGFNIDLWIGGDPSTFTLPSSSLSRRQQCSRLLSLLVTFRLESQFGNLKRWIRFTFPHRRRKSLLSLSVKGQLSSSAYRTLLINFSRSLKVSHDLNHSVDFSSRIGGRRFLVLSDSIFLDTRYACLVSRSLYHEP